MSSTNKTQHYNLSQFAAGDIPGWLSDVNSDMSKIDTAIYDLANTIAGDEADLTVLTGRVTTVENAQTADAAAITSLQNTTSTLSTDLTNLTSTVASNTSNITSLNNKVNASYSVAERSTGRKWVDGKDIYEKVVSGKLEASEAIGTLFRSVNTLITGVETLIKAYGHFERTSGVQSYIGSTQYASSGDITTTSSIVTNSGSVLFTVINNSEIVANTNNFIVVLEYTKATV